MVPCTRSQLITEPIMEVPAWGTGLLWPLKAVRELLMMRNMRSPIVLQPVLGKELFLEWGLGWVYSVTRCFVYHSVTAISYVQNKQMIHQLPVWESQSEHFHHPLVYGFTVLPVEVRCQWFMLYQVLVTGCPASTQRTAPQSLDAELFLLFPFVIY